MSKTLLIVSGGEETVAVARHARQAGHTVVVSDADPQAPAFALADSCLIADIYGVSETAAAAERYNRKIRKIDGVLCAADAVLTAATVADRLRLPGPPLHVAELLSDRLAIGRCFASAGIKTPWHAEIFTPQELQRAVVAKGRGLVLKPVENHGPNGAQRLMEIEDLNTAFQHTRLRSPSECVMVQQGLDGPHVQLAALMLGGICHVAGSPQAEFKDMAARAAAALGLSDGPIRIEIAMDQGAPHVVEISARLCGGAFLAAAIKLALGDTVSPGDLAP
jgi:biotin carboxylase